MGKEYEAKGKTGRKLRDSWHFLIATVITMEGEKLSAECTKKTVENSVFPTWEPGDRKNNKRGRR